MKSLDEKNSPLPKTAPEIGRGSVTQSIGTLPEKGVRAPKDWSKKP